MLYSLEKYCQYFYTVLYRFKCRTLLIYWIPIKKDRGEYINFSAQLLKNQKMKRMDIEIGFGGEGKLQIINYNIIKIL